MDQSVRIKSERSETFKKKSAISDKRSLRAHRRSLEWKQLRNDTVNQNRKLDSVQLSPLKEVQQSAPKTSGPLSRKDLLKKWREEKQLKKKLESKSKHQTFKVAHVQNELVPFSKPIASLPKVQKNIQSAKAVPKQAPTVPKTPKVARKLTVAAAGKRCQGVTAAAGKTGATQPTGKPTTFKVPEAPARRVTRSQTEAKAPARPTATTTSNTKPTKAGSRGATAKAKTSQPAKARGGKAGKPVARGKLDNNVTQERGSTSFAPASFQFTAPDNLKSFSFKPLSPASTAHFLGTSSLAFSPLSARRCSTPINPRSSSGPKVIHSPPQSAIAEVASSASESEDSQPKTVPAMITLSKSSTDSSDTDTVTSASRKSVRKSTCQKSEGNDAGDTKKDETQQAKPKQRKSLSKPRAAANKNKRKSTRKSVISPTLDHEVADKSKEPEEKSPKKLLFGSPTELQECENADKTEKSKRKSTRKSMLKVESSNEEAEKETDAKTENKPVVSSSSDQEQETSAVSDNKATTPRRKSSRKSNVQPAISPVRTQQENADTKEKVDGTPRSKSSRKSNVADPIQQGPTSTEEENAKDGKKSTVDPDMSPSTQIPQIMVASSSLDGMLAPRTPGSILRGSALSGTGKKRGGRTQSMCVSFTPNVDTPRNNRCSLLLRHVSPEEGMEILKNSPMVELERRSNKKKTPKRKSIRGGSSLALPSFDDLDDLPPPPATTSDAMSSVENITSDDMGSLHLCLSMSQSESQRESTSSSAAAVATSTTSESDIVQPSTMSSEDIPCPSTPTPPPSSSEPATEEPAPSVPAAPQDQDVHDVAYFRHMVKQESALLDGLCEKWTQVQEGLTDVSEEVLGQIRTVIGKAQLLTGRKGRFTQFISLVDACEFKTGEKETTEQDLQGFWDMVYFQVEDVYAMFGDLDKLRDQNWQSDVAKPKKVLKKVVKKKPATKTAAASSKPKGPSKFAAFRAQMKQKQQEPESEEAPAVESATSNLLQVPSQPTKTFEAGFFHVKSPVKSPEYHCEAGTPNCKSRPQTEDITPLKDNTQQHRSLMRTAVIRSARKSTRVRPVSPSEEHDAQKDDWAASSPSKKQCVAPVSSTKKEKSTTPAAGNNDSSLFTPDADKKSTRRKSVRRSINMGGGDSPAAAATDSSFSKFLLPTDTADESEVSEPMLELSLNTSPAAANPFSPTPSRLRTYASPLGTPRGLSASEKRRHRHSTRRSAVMAAATKENYGRCISPAAQSPLPAAAGSRRVSCFTPPTKMATPDHRQLESMEEEEAEDQTVNLMCFSPAKDASDRQQKSSKPTRSRKSSRISLL